jgi:glycosyltransferase involved in cell wall biosynthesis
MLLRFLPSYIRLADVVHLTAVYSFPTIPTLLICRLLNKPVVWSPRGALQRWKGSSRITAKALWEWVCRMAAPKNLVLHVTSREEAMASVKRFPGFETIVIPNGIEIPEKVSHDRGNEVLRLFYLGRLHPIKGIENLLASCKIINDRSGIAWSLTIAGSGDPHYTDKIRSKIKALGLSDRVKMAGHIRREDKQVLFENADIAVIPSHSENFGMVVAEALAHSVPVIAAKGTPWKRLEEMGCGLWVDNDPESLAKAIERMSRMPLREMGQRGRDWMQKEFSWDQRSHEMVACYTALSARRKTSVRT